METKTCPHCKELKRADAGTCPHCGKDQPTTAEKVTSLGCLLLGTWPLLLVIGFILYVAIF